MAQSTRDEAARRRRFFELWADCAETGEPELVEGARRRARCSVRFVQVKLKGAAGFTAEELAKLNATRRSKAAFDPYR